MLDQALANGDPTRFYDCFTDEELIEHYGLIIVALMARGLAS
jgi:hypothetical protein